SPSHPTINPLIPPFPPRSHHPAPVLLLALPLSLRGTTSYLRSLHASASTAGLLCQPPQSVSLWITRFLRISQFRGESIKESSAGGEEVADSQKNFYVLAHNPS
ncbi:hypothetical protein LINGRAHAP2_LOCUS10111, partial [Linum grandiflorum]